MFLDLSELFPGLSRGGADPRLRPQRPVGGACASVGPAGPGQQRGWGRPPLSGLTHLPRQPPYHPPSGSPRKVTLGGERPAPPPRLPADAPEHWAAFSVSPSPPWGWGQCRGPRRGRAGEQRPGRQACSEARASPYLSGPLPSAGGQPRYDHVQGEWTGRAHLGLVPTPSPSGAWGAGGSPSPQSPHLGCVIQPTQALWPWVPTSWAVWN